MTKPMPTLDEMRGWVFARLQGQGEPRPIKMLEAIYNALGQYKEQKNDPA